MECRPKGSRRFSGTSQTINRLKNRCECAGYSVSVKRLATLSRLGCCPSRRDVLSLMGQSLNHRTLTWTTRFLTCTHTLMHAITHEGVRTHVRESALKVKSVKKKNPLPHREIEPVSAARRCDALRTELHPQPKPRSEIPAPCNATRHRNLDDPHELNIESEGKN